MLTMYRQFWKSLWGMIFLASCLPAFAWQVTLRSPNETDGTPAQVVVSNQNALSNRDVYLVWFDQDATATDEQFLSWTVAQGWAAGLRPAFDEAVDLPVFDSYAIDFEETSCPDTHRCFLAFVTTLPDQNPLQSSAWQVSSFLPLNLSAGCERFPGQQFFLSCDGGLNRFDAVDDVALTAPDSEEAAPAADEKASGQETEKPDIFKRVGNRLLYANGQAQRFQVIDITDVSNPLLESWLALAGSPRELYVLGDYYVLLQTDYVGDNGTHLTVLTQGEEGTLTTVHDMSLAGRFIESRRRGQFIYAVTQDLTSNEQLDDCLGCRISGQALTIKALRLTEAGQLEEVDNAQLFGYSPTVAIFPDYLVVANHNPAEEKWQTTQIQAFDLSQPDKALVALPTLTVPGRVPSEFHLSVKNQQLRVVYGPEDREHGSTLAIYDLTSPKLAVIGKVEAIAPGEDLFATRFVDNRAFVVTFERKDPLWVIDLSDASNPTIIGELHVPGWSERMFFHDDRLFAVGIDDQPTDNEETRWVSRVALSLFDVADPTQPTLINRLTPLVDETTHSWSPALTDERALLLDWEEAFAALPIESYDTQSGNHLQLVSLANDKIEDAGRLDSPVSLQRSLSLAPDVLAALGDQALLTLRWGQGDPQILGELELATNVTWLNLQAEQLWAAAMGNNGIHRFYRYTTDDLEMPAARWQLPNSYDGVKMDNNLVVFYDYYPALTVQVLDVNTGELQAAQVLETQPEPTTSPADDSTAADIAIDTDIAWYNRSQALLHEGWFYMAEQRAFQPTMREQTAHLLRPEKDDYYQQAEWVLRRWNMTLAAATEAQSLSIPGNPLAFTNNGELITQEVTNNGLLRLNLLALETGNANLLHSRELPCQGYSQVIWAADSLYVKCEEPNEYVPGPIIMEDTVNDGRAEEEGDQDEPEPPPEQQLQPTTQVLRLNPGQGFTEDGSWTLDGYRNIQAASSDIVLLGAGYGWYEPWLLGDAVAVKSAARSLLPNYQNGCDVYQLRPDNEPVLLKQLDNCPYNTEGLVLTPNQAWMAEGFAGIKAVNW